MTSPVRRISAEFYRTDAGNEPVRDFLKSLGRPSSIEMGSDISLVERGCKLGKPWVDQLRRATGSGSEPIYEVRHTVAGLEYRTLFFVYGSRMILTHCFQKTSQRTPVHEIDVAWARMKKWLSEQRKLEGKRR